MNISDSDKPKIIVLICLVVFVIAFGAYRFRSVTKPSPQKTSRTKSIADSPLPDNESKPRQEDVYLAFTGSERDPFMPLITPQVKKTTMADKQISSAERTPRPGGELLPPLGIQKVTEDENQDVVESSEEEVLPNFRLVGVIIGDKNMAVIRGDNDARYMVYEGQSIEGKYLVKYVSRSGVYLKYKDRTFELKLGGQDAAQKQS